MQASLLRGLHEIEFTRKHNPIVQYLQATSVTCTVNICHLLLPDKKHHKLLQLCLPSCHIYTFKKTYFEISLFDSIKSLYIINDDGFKACKYLDSSRCFTQEKFSFPGFKFFSKIYLNSLNRVTCCLVCSLMQKRNIWSNVRLVTIPFFLCLLLVVIQLLFDSQFNEDHGQCGCLNEKTCGLRYSTSDQAAFCAIPNPSQWTPLLQIPSPQYRAATTLYLSHSSPVTFLFTGNNQSLGESINHINNSFTKQNIYKISFYFLFNKFFFFVFQL